MLNSNYINRFYAYNALEYYFSSQDDVFNYVLTNLSDDDKLKVYSDPDYGLSTIDGLARWSDAAIANTKTAMSAQATALQTYWASQ